MRQRVREKDRMRSTQFGGGKESIPPWDSLVSILLTPNFNEDCPEGPTFVVRGGVNKIRENRFL